MSYEIIIKETRTFRKIVGGDYTVIDTKEVPRDETYYRGSADEPKTRIAEVRGYTPEIEKTVEETREVLKQTVDTLDLQAVIKAINNLP